MGSISETQQQEKEEKKNPLSADRVMITYYTDPLCCWSWAQEPQWKKIKEEYCDQIEYRYVMGGMLQDWQTYNDPLNAITRPLQFGPVWMHASQISGIPMDSSIWHKDPPASSYPSCIAVKCAMLQSDQAGEHLLGRLREAVMTRALNIAHRSVIFTIAQSLAEEGQITFNMDEFMLAWENGSGQEAFRQDLYKARFHKIGRYPTMTFTTKASTGIIVTGFKPYEVLKAALDKMLSA